MSGQCYSCGTEFSVFKKEHGCKNCGFSFCGKCLNDKSIPVPKRNNTKHHVCHKCYKILTGGAKESREEQTFDLPEAYLKRVAALKERETKGPTPHTANSSRGGHAVPEHLRRLDRADREIALRLEQLKSDDKQKEKVSDSDIQARLARLKGEKCVPDQKPVHKPPDHRPEVQQVDDLIEQLIAEVEIDNLRPDPVQEVEERLAKYRQDERKSVIDDNNLNQWDKGGTPTEANDLNKVDKLGSMGRGCIQDGRNIQVTKPGASARGGEQIDLEEMQRLMSQAAREIELDAQRALQGIQQDKELMDKLREIQKHKTEKASNDSDTVDSDADNTAQTGNTATADGHATDDDDDDDLAAARLAQRYFDEVKIDKATEDSFVKTDKSSVTSVPAKEKVGRKNKENKVNATVMSAEQKQINLKPPVNDNNVDSDYDDADELPYCCICTEDATIRCRDCDMDLYCLKCFKGCHEEMEITDHRTAPYKAPKGYR